MTHMSEKPDVKVNNENNSWTGVWIAIVIFYLSFRNHDDNEFDLYDLIYQLLSKQIGN